MSEQEHSRSYSISGSESSSEDDDIDDNNTKNSCNDEFSIQSDSRKNLNQHNIPVPQSNLDYNQYNQNLNDRLLQTHTHMRNNSFDESDDNEEMRTSLTQKDHFTKPKMEGIGGGIPNNNNNNNTGRKNWRTKAGNLIRSIQQRRLRARAQFDPAGMTNHELNQLQREVECLNNDIKSMRSMNIATMADTDSQHHKNNSRKSSISWKESLQNIAAAPEYFIDGLIEEDDADHQLGYYTNIPDADNDNNNSDDDVYVGMKSNSYGNNDSKEVNLLKAEVDDLNSQIKFLQSQLDKKNEEVQFWSEKAKTLQDKLDQVNNINNTNLIDLNDSESISYDDDNNDNVNDDTEESEQNEYDLIQLNDQISHCHNEEGELIELSNDHMIQDCDSPHHSSVPTVSNTNILIQVDDECTNDNLHPPPTQDSTSCSHSKDANLLLLSLDDDKVDLETSRCSHNDLLQISQTEELTNKSVGKEDIVDQPKFGNPFDF